MTAADRNDDFETFLQRRSLLAQADDGLEPPGAVDEAVLKKARAAIQGRRPATRAARWAMPVGLAATILLCLSIVLNVTLNTNRPAPVSAARQAAPAAGEGATTLRESTAMPRDDASIARDEAQVAHQKASEARNAVAARREGEADALAAPGTLSAPTSSIAGGLQSAPTPSAAYNAKPAPPPLGSAAQSARTPSVASATQPAPNTEPSFAAAAQAPAPMSAQRELKRSAAPFAKREANDAATHSDPKVWLQQIEALRNEGKTAEADAEMKRFRAAFPAYPVTPPSPDSLK